ncbi:MAG: tyrosine-type recombinase/integrase [Pseudomonadota bacterium]
MKFGVPKRLTVAQIESLKPSSVRQEYSDGGSALRLVVFPSGIKSWAYRFRAKGRTRKLTLGRYPAIDLKDARLLANEALLKVAMGEDPATEKQDSVHAKAETIRCLVPEYIEKWQKPRNRTWAETESSLLRVLVIPLGHMKVHDIKQRDIVVALDGKNRRTLANVKRFFNWCCEQGLIEASPAQAVRSPDPVSTRDRVLSDKEISVLFTVLPKLGSPWSAILELLLLTGQRRGEVAEATWDEINLDLRIWQIGKHRAKNGRTHAIPLSPRAVEVISGLSSREEGGFLFPADRRGRGAASGFSKIKRRLDALIIEHLASCDQNASVEPWRIHDLRRTAATGMARLGTPPHVVEAILNHSAGKISGVAAIYNRFDYAREKQAAMDDWADFLAELK